MITQAILDFIASVPFFILDALPALSISLPNVVFEPIFNVVAGIGTIMPVRALLPILQIEFAFLTFNIVWSLIIRTKSFIPTMGA